MTGDEFDALLRRAIMGSESAVRDLPAASIQMLREFFGTELQLPLAVEGLERALAHSCWIPVGEGLPAEQKVVLVAHSGRGASVGRWTGSDWRSDAMAVAFEYGGDPGPVTHWMTLPEPPR